MQVRLIALDLDGTTLCSDHLTLPEPNRIAIARAASQGVQVVISTGRIRGRIPQQLREIPGLRYAVTSNGAAVCDLVTGETLYSNPVPQNLALRVLREIAPFGLYTELYCSGSSYVDRQGDAILSRIPVSEGRRAMIRSSREQVESLSALAAQPDACVEKINLPFIPPHQIEEVWALLGSIGGLAVTSSVAGNAEVNAASANKGDGLSHLCGRLDIRPEEVMAVGDNGNDLEMLRFAGLAVAPKNALPEIRELADHVTASNNDCGVAQAIDRFVPYTK